MSSIDMKGFSLTVLQLENFKDQKLILDSIDLPVDSPFWVKSIDTSLIKIEKKLKSTQNRQ